MNFIPDNPNPITTPIPISAIPARIPIIFPIFEFAFFKAKITRIAPQTTHAGMSVIQVKIHKTATASERTWKYRSRNVTANTSAGKQSAMHIMMNFLDDIFFISFAERYASG